MCVKARADVLRDVTSRHGLDGECRGLRGYLTSEDHGRVTDESRPLLGRNGELRDLEAVLGDAAVRRGRVALLIGEAGIGKTCLVEEMARLAAAEGFAVGWGRCSPTDMPPYWPWIQVLKFLLGTAEVLEVESSRPPSSSGRRWPKPSSRALD